MRGSGLLYNYLGTGRVGKRRARELEGTGSVDNGPASVREITKIKLGNKFKLVPEKNLKGKKGK